MRNGSLSPIGLQAPVFALVSATFTATYMLQTVLPELLPGRIRRDHDKRARLPAVRRIGVTGIGMRLLTVIVAAELVEKQFGKHLQ
jgi:hypothetical protein